MRAHPHQHVGVTDCLHPEGWTRSMMNNVPVAPRLDGQTLLDYIEHILNSWSEMRDDPWYAPTTMGGANT